MDNKNYSIVKTFDNKTDTSFLGKFGYEGLDRIISFNDFVLSNEYPCWICPFAYNPEDWEKVEKAYWEHVSYLRGDWIFLKIYAEGNKDGVIIRTEGTHGIRSNDKVNIREAEQKELRKLENLIYVYKS